MATLENLSGKRFGYLTVIELVGRKDKSATWKCVCDCGRERIARAINLKTSAAKSCGKRKECNFAWQSLNMHENIEGLRFGRLIAIERIRTESGARWRCVCDCGNEAQTTTNKLKSGHTSSCGCLARERASECRGEKRYNWNGGRFLDPHGYVKIQMPGHHRANRRGYVYEHLVVMENKIGRRLIGKENVHHINGDRQDNREENLELWSVSQPKGQRIEDKLNHAIDIIKTYGDRDTVLELLKNFDLEQ